MVPGALGARAGSMPHKLSTLLHTLRLECGEAVDGMLATLLCLTTDMGAELGLAEAVSTGGLWSIIQPALQQPALEVDDGVGGDGGDGGGGHGLVVRGPADAHDAHVLPRCIPIPGIQHILDNLTADIHGVMVGWPRFVEELSAVCDILCKPECLEHFLQSCVREGGHQKYEPLFARAFHPVVEWRWGSLMNTLTWLLPLEGALRRIWDPARYNSAARPRRAAEEPKTAIVTQAVQSRRFWSYAQLCCHLQCSIERISWWSRGCPCHAEPPWPALENGRLPTPAELSHRRYRRSQVFCKLLGPTAATSWWQRCPMEGKRAPELACGALAGKVDETFTEGGRRVIEACAGLGDAERDTVLSDWSRASAAIAHIVQAKTAFWQSLPWRLCGLAHQSAECASAAAADCIRAFDEHPAAQHRVAVEFLAVGGPLRVDVERLAAGAVVESLSETSIVRILQLKFIPTVEFIIEGRHAMVKHALPGKKKKRSPITVSLSSGRFGEFQHRVAEPTFLRAFGENFDRVRNARQQAFAFGFTGHPRVRSAMQPGSHHTRLGPSVTEVFYHCAPEDQHLDMTAARQDQANEQKALLRQKREMERLGNGGPGEVTHASVVSAAMQEHFLRKCREEGAGATISLPDSGPDAGTLVAALPDLLASPVGRAPLLLPVAAGVPAQSAIEDDTGTGDGPRDTGVLAEACEAGGVPEVAEVFLKVVSASPGAWHVVPVMPGAGKRLKGSDLVVSTHALAGATADGNPVIVARPRQVGASTVSRLGVLARLNSSREALEERAKLWHQGRMGYFWRGVAINADIIEVASSLVAAGAFESHVAAVDDDSDATEAGPPSVAICGARHVEVCRSMALEGLVALVYDEGVRTFWRLTPAGVDRLECCEALSNPRAVFEPADADSLADATVYQLIRHLELDGWGWRLLPRSRTQREAISYRPLDADTPKVWCSRRVATSWLYLTALAHGRVIAQGGVAAAIHHGRPDAEYRSLLESAGVLQPRTVDTPALDLEVDDGGAVGAVGEQVVGGVVLDGPSPVSPPGSPASASDGTHSARWADALAESLGMAAEAEEAAEVEVARAGAEEEQDEAAAVRLQRPSALNFNWGAFRFTLKRMKGRSGTALAWQCSCPFHRKSAVTECRKAMTVGAGPWQVESDRVLWALKAWANRALEYDRQRHHIMDTPVPGCHAAPEIIEAQCIRERPAVQPRTDDELDVEGGAGEECEEAVASSSSPSPSSSSSSASGSSSASSA